MKKMNKFIKILAVIAIVAVVFGVAYGADFALDKTEKMIYPQRFESQITKYSVEYNIPEYVIYAIIKTESDFDATAVSSVGAMGLMQMMPSTFLWLTGSEHLGEGLPAEALFIPDVSIRYGTYYLEYLYKKFDRNWDNAFAAYNGGEGNVAKWLDDPRYSDGEGGLKDIPFKETRNYVKKVNTAMEKYKELYYEPNEGVAG